MRAYSKYIFSVITLLFFLISCKKESTLPNPRVYDMLYKKYDPVLKFQIDQIPAFSTDTTISLDLDIDNNDRNDFQFKIREGQEFCNPAWRDLEYQYIVFTILDTSYRIISDYDPLNPGTLNTVNLITLNEGDTLNQKTPQKHFAKWVNGPQIITNYNACAGTIWSMNEGTYYIPIAKVMRNKYKYGWIKFGLTGTDPILSANAVIDLFEFALDTIPNEEIIVGERR